MLCKKCSRESTLIKLYSMDVTIWKEDINNFKCNISKFIKERGKASFVKSDKRFSEVAIIKAYISGSLPPQLIMSPMALSDIESISDFDSDH